MIVRILPLDPDWYESCLVSIGQKILSHVSRQAVGGSDIGQFVNMEYVFKS